jgi:hypothetical protein
MTFSLLYCLYDFKVQDTVIAIGIAKESFTVVFYLLDMMIIVIIMSIGWEYISEVRPPTGLLFISQVIYEHGEPYCNNIDMGKSLIRPTELSGNSASRVIW